MKSQAAVFNDLPLTAYKFKNKEDISIETSQSHTSETRTPTEATTFFLPSSRLQDQPPRFPPNGVARQTHEERA